MFLCSNNSVIKLSISGYEKVKLEGKILSSQNQKPIKGALVLEVSALASTFSNENGTFTLEVEAENFQELHLSISKEGFKDSLIRIDFGEEKVSIQLSALSPAEIEKDISPMPQKGYETFTYSRVLVPKKVQKRTELSPFNFYRAYQFSLFPGISTNQKMSGNLNIVQPKILIRKNYVPNILQSTFLQHDF